MSGQGQQENLKKDIANLISDYRNKGLHITKISQRWVDASDTSGYSYLEHPGGLKVEVMF